MPDKRCPMCGKPNPQEAETCKYCQARLKPLIKPAMPGSTDPTRRRPPLTGRNASDLDSSLPDWLKDLRSPQDNTANEPASSENLPGLTPEDNAEPDADSGVPDWFSRIEPGGEQKQAAKPGDQQNLPDWLASLGTSGQPAEQFDTSTEGEVDSSPLEEPGENEPDWLSRIQARQRGEDTPEEEMPPAEEDLPGEPAPKSSSAAEQLPEWLSNLGKKEASSSEKTSEEMDWSFLEDEQKPAAEEEPIPDWLAPLEDNEHAGFSLEEPASPANGEILEEPSEETSEEVEGDVPLGPVEAFTGLEDELGVEPDADSAPLASSKLPRADEAMPDWLKRLEATTSDKAPGESVPAFVEAEDEGIPLPVHEPQEPVSNLLPPDLNALPEWISQVPTEDVAAEETNADAAPAAKPAESDSLMPAELPSWLEAMRPVEAAAPPLTNEADQARVEKAGPLAGLRGALSAEPGALVVQKPKVFSSKLQITEGQQAHMALMEELLKSEGEAKPVVSHTIVNAQYVMRILVALILLLAVLAPLWLKNNMAPLPSSSLAPQEVLDASRLVTGLTPGGRVLLAFDYEPGLSGEMDVAATTLVEQLMSRSAYLAIVSTNVSGPLLAERLLADLNVKNGTPYASVVNLGYVPGGASALLSLAENPRQVLPYDLHSSNVWVDTPLSSIKSTADFALVVVLTEKADAARGWIEQVGPTLQKNNTPLLMLVSAQAEPMVLPYYETNPKQVDGMVSGMAGFAAYESVAGRTGLARSYWDAYGGGMLAGAGLLILGGLMYGGMLVFSPRKRTKGEGVE
jgi:hypothetical protein